MTRRTPASGLPRVTIVTPSLNQAAYLEETIRSVASQNYPNLEHWIIDGGSTDGSLDIIRRWAGRRKSIRWVSEKDRGQSDAINKGFRRATGEIVSWLNSDDAYTPGAVRRAAEFLASHPDCMLAYSEAAIVDERGALLGTFPHTQRIFNYRRLVAVSDYIAQPSAFIRRKALDEVGLLEESLHWCMDWDLWIRIAEKYPVLYFPSLTAHMRDYGQTKTRKGGRRRWKEIVSVARKHSGLRFPPAYFIYGLESAATRLRLDRSARSRLKRTVLFKVINYCINRHFDIYADGWVTRKIEFSFFGAPGHFRLKGYWPARNAPARLDIVLNGRRLRTCRVATGGMFSVTVPIPGVLRAPGRNALLLRSSRLFTPGPHDRRRLSFRLIDHAFPGAAAARPGTSVP
jgi:glycosyltransferase involved in cell wall biosynthesis